MGDVGVPGVEDTAGLTRWIRDNDLPGAGDDLTVELIAGGRSNLTYRLEFRAPGDAAAGDTAPGDAAPGDVARGDGAPGSTVTRLVLRRPPLGHVLPTAHDMGREYRVLSALHGTAVPVPRPVAICQDTEVIGAPFYLMEWVDGVVFRTNADARLLSPAQAGQVCEDFAGMLATIHGLDVGAVGLDGFGKPEGYMARQLARWQRQWDLSVTREMPGYAELVERLAAGLPAEGGPGSPQAGGSAGTLVHGDFRIDNMLIKPGPEPRIAAVVDWEMSTLGDPLADLGLSLVYWTEAGEEDLLPHAMGDSVTTAAGFLTRDQIAARYADLTGRDLSRLDYYMAFGCFKLAVVLEGIHARFLQHKTVGEGFEREGQAVATLIGRAHQLLDGRT
jgi:aminoglycoside phosphotransferase (APT) family kinase protein